MARADMDTIIQDLSRRFAAPLPEFYKRRIIFWYDEDREFEDKISEIELPNVTIVTLTGENSVAVKKLLAVDDTIGNYTFFVACSTVNESAALNISSISLSEYKYGT